MLKHGCTTNATLSLLNSHYQQDSTVPSYVAYSSLAFALTTVTCCISIEKGTFPAYQTREIKVKHSFVQVTYLEKIAYTIIVFKQYEFLISAEPLN